MSDIRPRAPELELVEPGSPEWRQANIAGCNRAVRLIGEAMVQQLAPAFQRIVEVLSVPPAETQQPDHVRELHRHILRVNAGNARRQARRRREEHPR